MYISQFDLRLASLPQISYRKRKRKAYPASRVQNINGDFFTIYSHSTAITIL